MLRRLGAGWPQPAGWQQCRWTALPCTGRALLLPGRGSGAGGI
jgi:hypothetical protein